MHDARVPPGGEAAPGSAAASWMFAADRLFELFALTFFVTRLVLYPYAICSDPRPILGNIPEEPHSPAIPSWQVRVLVRAHRGDALLPEGGARVGVRRAARDAARAAGTRAAVPLFAQSFPLMLLALQVYWFWLILKVAIKLITTGKVEDVRSDSEDEADAPKKKTK
jgi:hypothetical protein